MVNADRHNSQVKVKMTVDGFRRNLRGVNEGENFPDDMLDDIFNSIVSEEIR